MDRAFAIETLDSGSIPRRAKPKTVKIGIHSQEWQYSTVRTEFAYYVPRTLNCTVPAYRTSVQFLKRTVPTYHTRTFTKKAYRTSVTYFISIFEAYRTNVPYPYHYKKNVPTNVPYFLAKIEAYRTVPTYRSVPYCHRCSHLSAFLA